MQVTRSMARSKPSKPTRDHLRRDDSHITDEKAQRHFRSSIPPEWIVNHFERDYGKDFHVELTGEGGRVTQAFYVQLKGTAGKCKHIDNGAAISFSLEHKYLSYYLREVKLPVFLVVVDVSSGRGYWLFTQQYLTQHPGWKKGGSYSLRIPTANKLEDTPALAQGVADALNWMVVYQQKPLQDRVREHILALEAKDPRYRVKATFSEEMARLQLIPKEPVRLKFHICSKKKRFQARMHADFFDRGLPVEFGAGELVVEGSALLQELVASGGTAQLCARSDCQLTLIAYDEHDSPVEVWPGISAEITGGTKEWRFQGRAGRSPLAVKVGPLGGTSQGSVNLSVTAREWLGQPLLGVSYFDKMVAFFSKLSRYPCVGTRFEIEGNTVFDTRVRLEDVGQFGSLTHFLQLFGKAREVAKRYDLNPICSAENLSGEALRDIEIAHAILTTGQYESPSKDWRVDITFPKTVATGLLDGDRVVRDLVLFADEGTRLPFMGQEISLGRLAWDLTEADVYTPEDELRRLMASQNEDVTVSFRTNSNTRGVLRQVPDEEWTEYTQSTPDGVTRSGAAAIDWKGGRTTLPPG